MKLSSLVPGPLEVLRLQHKNIDSSSSLRFNSTRAMPHHHQHRLLTTTMTNGRNSMAIPQQVIIPVTLAVLVGLGLFLAGSTHRIGCKHPCVPGDESIMASKEHGTSHTAAQENLRWNCNWKTADRICNFNRRYAERFGYWRTTSFQSDITESKLPMVFYDSVTGKPLFEAPKGRTLNEFLEESREHGWPSFRDEEVNWNHVRLLPNGETVSVDGTHLGHNLPDGRNRYCINLVSIAGNPSEREHIPIV